MHLNDCPRKMCTMLYYLGKTNSVFETQYGRRELIVYWLVGCSACAYLPYTLCPATSAHSASERAQMRQEACCVNAMMRAFCKQCSGYPCSGQRRVCATAPHESMCYACRLGAHDPQPSTLQQRAAFVSAKWRTLNMVQHND